MRDISTGKNLFPPARYTTLMAARRCLNKQLALPVPYGTFITPWGYYLCEETPGKMEPIDELFGYLFEATKYLRTSSYQNVADWLSEVSGRSISKQSLFDLLRQRTPFKECLLSREEREKLGYTFTSEDFSKQAEKAKERLKEPKGYYKTGQPY